MDDRQDFYNVLFPIKEVDYPVLAMEYFSDSRIVSFWKHSAHFRHLLQTLNSLENTCYEDRGVARRCHDLVPLALISRLFELLDHLRLRDTFPLLFQSGANFA